MSRKFSLKSKNEVLAYYKHPVLGKRYRDVCSILLENKDQSILSIFGHPEYLKVYSSISLFRLLIKEDVLFEKLLDKYFDGRIDDKTLSILSTL